MINKLDEFLDKKYIYAIIGVSENKEKYGYKIFKQLLDLNFKIVPINPKLFELEGLKCYKSILDFNDKIDIVNFVVPPSISLKILDEVVKKNIKKVWFQPGSWNDDCLKFCKKHKISVIKDFCLLKSSLKI